MTADPAEPPLGPREARRVKTQIGVPRRMVDPDVRALRERFTAPHELVPTSDGKTLFVRHWLAPTSSNRALLLFPGITAYSEPYGPAAAEEIARAGWEVFGVDLRGHGRSDGVRGDYPSADQWTDDVGRVASFVKQRFSRVVVLGHSLGAFSAIAALNHAPAAVDGLVVVSGGTHVRPGAYPRPTARAVVRALLGVTVFPSRPLIEYRRTGMVGRDDPLFNFRYSARFFSTIYGMPASSVLRMMRQNRIDSPNLVVRGSPDLPVWVGVGDQDEIFPVDSARSFFEGIASHEKEFVVLPGATHTRFPPGSWSALVTWLDARFPASASGPRSVPTDPPRR